MNALQDLVTDVTDWHVDHFGTDSMQGALAQKLREESQEACIAIWENLQEICKMDRVAEECADVLIVLCAIAGRNDIDLLAEARKKLQIVKARDQRARDAERGIL